MQRRVSGRGSGIEVIRRQVCENTTALGGARIKYSNRRNKIVQSAGCGKAKRGVTGSSDRLGAMPNPSDLRSNVATWWGLLFAIVALGCNGVFFLSLPFQGAIPWLSLLFAAVALTYLVMGLRLAIVHPKIYRRRALTVIVTVIAVIPASLSVVGFAATHKLPSATAAPQVGQKVPDFTLADTSGKAVSLDQLLAASSVVSPAEPSFESRAPKAVLLIFYRGYW